MDLEGRAVRAEKGFHPMIAEGRKTLRIILKSITEEKVRIDRSTTEFSFQIFPVNQQIDLTTPSNPNRDFEIGR